MPHPGSNSLSDIAQIREAAEGSSDAAVLKDYEEQLHSDLISYHENYFIHVASRTEEARACLKNILSCSF